MTKFRPCIDLHQGQVKQIVGSTLTTESNELATNFSTNKPAAEYAALYCKDQLTGGHVIMLGPGNTDAAQAAVKAYPNHLQIGGGINETNCNEWIQLGASHVIITSAVFKDGRVYWEKLRQIVDIIGKDRLVLDLSCRKKEGNYYVVTDKWQQFTDYTVTPENLQELSQYCDEFLVHGVDVEGKQCGILEDLVTLLEEHSPVPVTYAGGVRSVEDLDLVERLGKGKVDITVGSALDIFGGSLSYDDVVKWHKERNAN